MEAFDYIDYEVEDGRARITLNRPEKLNALIPDLLHELQEALWEADDNRAVHCVILRGAGRAFSAGHDLTGSAPEKGYSRVRSDENTYRGSQLFDDDAWQIERAQRFRMAIFDMHKPVIAQVHGFCLAAATDLALLCDMVICADDTRFAFPAVRDMGSPAHHMWLYHVGPQWAKRILLTGDSISGTDAQQIGLVLKAVPAELLEQEVEQLADRLVLIDPNLLSANKRIVNQGLELMGARTLQRMAAENDVRAHNSGALGAWRERVAEKGLKDALRERNAEFGDDYVRVGMPEQRE